MIDDDNELTTAEEETPGYRGALLDDFVLSLEDEPQVLRIHDFAPRNDPKYFISARHPGLNEDKVLRAGGGWVTPINRQAQRTQEVEQRLEQTPGAAFLAKCRYQIEDFLLPMGPGKPDVGFDPSKGGWGERNQEVYRSILKQTGKGGRLGLLEIVEGFLDFVAGRETMLAETYADLFPVPGKPAATS